jgi:hypothetical protein
LKRKETKSMQKNQKLKMLRWSEFWDFQFIEFEKKKEKSKKKLKKKIPGFQYHVQVGSQEYWSVFGYLSYVFIAKCG